MLMQWIYIIVYGWSVFILIAIVLHCVNVSQISYHLTLKEHLSSFQFGAIMNHVAVNKITSLTTYVPVFMLVKYLSVELLAQKV